MRKQWPQRCYPALPYRVSACSSSRTLMLHRRNPSLTAAGCSGFGRPQHQVFMPWRRATRRTQRREKLSYYTTLFKNFQFPAVSSTRLRNYRLFKTTCAMTVPSFVNAESNIRCRDPCEIDLVENSKLKLAGRYIRDIPYQVAKILLTTVAAREVWPQPWLHVASR